MTRPCVKAMALPGPAKPVRVEPVRLPEPLREPEPDKREAPAEQPSKPKEPAPA